MTELKWIVILPLAIGLLWASYKAGVASAQKQEQALTRLAAIEQRMKVLSLEKRLNALEENLNKQQSEQCEGAKQ